MTYQPMNPDELAARRAELGFSPEELAAELGVPVHQAEAWQAGTIPVPKRIAADLRYRAARAAWERQFTDAGIPECPWVLEWSGRAASLGSWKMDRHIKRLVAHTASCERCQAREAFAKTLPPLPEGPRLPGLAGIIQWFMAWADTLPVWARPAVLGGAGFGGATLLRNVIMLPLAVRDPVLGVKLLTAVALATAGGAYAGLIGGFIYRWMRRVAATQGALATYLAGTAGAVGLAACTAVPITVATGEAASLLSWTAAEVLLVLTLPLGVMFGAWLRREARAGQPVPG